MALESVLTIFMIIVLCPVLPCVIFHIIVADELLSCYTSFVFLTCALIFISSCFFNLSAVASLRIKELAKDIPIEMLSDSDLESDDEKDVTIPVKKWRFSNIPTIFWNFFAFSKFHFSYGFISTVGSICLITAVVLGIFKLLLEKNTSTQDDLLHSIILLVITGIALLAIVLTIANKEGLYVEDTSYLRYNTFDEFIHVPMNVIVGRTFAAFLTGRYRHTLQFGFGLVLFVYGLYAFLSILDLSRDEIRRWQHATQVGNIRFAVMGIMLFAILSGILLVLRVTQHYYEKAKQSLLIIMEQNWQRNLSACELLLQTEKSDTLSGLKKSLRDKAKKRKLTIEEKQALEYLTLPLWKPKRAFAEKRK